MAFNAQLEDAPYNGGSFFVNDPAVFVLRIFLISIDGMGGSVLSGVSLDTIGSRHLPGLISQIPLVHDVQKRRKLVAVLIFTVHTVCNGNKMNPMLPEEHLGIKAGLQIVTACTAHIFYDHTADLSGFNVSNHAFPIGTLKIAAGPSIVRIVGKVGVAVLDCVVFEVCFLVQNGVAFSHEVIITGQALVQRRNLILSLFHAHDALLSD